MNDKSAISIYRPKPVLLPKSIKQHPQVQAILLEYLEEVVYGNNSNAPIRLAWDLNDDPQVRAGLGGNGRNVGDGNNGSSDDNDASSDAMNNNSKPYNQFNHPPSSLYKSMSQDDKLGLLQEPIPLSFDTFLLGNKLVTIGPALPELDELLGTPQLLLSRRDSRKSGKNRGDGNLGGGDDNIEDGNLDGRDGSIDETNPPIEIKYFNESINYRLCSGRNIIYSNALKYSIATQLPQELLDNPSDWQLEFRYKFVLDGKHEEFNHNIDLQPNPFNDRFGGKSGWADRDIGGAGGDAAKSTLVTLQKDNPPALIKEWCEYYHTKHQVQRIVLYNNRSINESINEPINESRNAADNNRNNNSNELVAELNEWTASLSSELEIHLVEWDYSYQSYFTQCQTGALTHCYWLVGDAASYFLNFDLDEYLVNDTGRSLDNCLAPAISTHRGIIIEGVIIKGYEPTTTNPSNPTLDIQGTAGTTGTTEPSNKETPANPKYIIAPKSWQVLTPHSILKKNFFPAPPSWHLLTAIAGGGVKFIFAKHLYRLSVRLFYILQGTKRRLGLKELPSAMTELNHTSTNLHFIHRTNHTTAWKWKI